MAWIGIWFGTSNNCGVWSNGVGQNRETDEEHDEDYVKKAFHLAKMKFDKYGKGGRKAPGVRLCSISTWNGLEKTVHILKTIFQYFYCLAIRIHRCMMIYIEYIS